MLDVLNPSCLGSAEAQQDHTHPPLCCGPASPATAAATLLLPLLLLLLLLAGDTQSCPIFERRWEAGTIAGADAKSQTASVPVAQVAMPLVQCECDCQFDGFSFSGSRSARLWRLCAQPGRVGKSLAEGPGPSPRANFRQKPPSVALSLTSSSQRRLGKHSPEPRIGPELLFRRCGIWLQRPQIVHPKHSAPLSPPQRLS